MKYTESMLRESAERVYNRTPAQSRDAMRYFHARVIAAAKRCGNKTLEREARAVLAKMTP